MRKLTLKLDDLAVETFSVDSQPASGGTVHGWGQTPENPIPHSDQCPPGQGITAGTCIGPTQCCWPTGGSNPMCQGPTLCCNPTANTGCCVPPQGGPPNTVDAHTCGAVSCFETDCTV